MATDIVTPEQAGRLEDVLLLQLALKYGTDDTEGLASRLRSHPLLSQAAEQIKAVDALACKLALDRLLGLTADRTASSVALAAKLAASRDSRIREVTRQIAEAEALYKAAITSSSDVATGPQVLRQDRATIAPADGSAERDSASDASSVKPEPEPGPEPKSLSQRPEQTSGPLVTDLASKESVNAVHSGPAIVVRQPSPGRAAHGTVSDAADMERAVASSTNLPQVHTTEFIPGTGTTVLDVVAGRQISDDRPPEAESGPRRKPGRGRKRSKSVAEHTSAASRDASVASVAVDIQAIATNKRFQSMVLNVLANIASHKCASIFAFPVSAKEAPTYRDMIRQPTDLKTMKARIKSGEIASGPSFHLEICRMFSNAIMFNHDNSDVAEMTREMYEHAEVGLRDHRQQRPRTDSFIRKRSPCT